MIRIKLLLALVVPLLSAVAVATAGELLSQGGMEVEFDSLGTPCRVSFGGESVFSSEEDSVPFAFGLRNPAELKTPASDFGCVAVSRPSPTAIRFEVTNGLWSCSLYTQIEPKQKLLRRWMDFKWTGSESRKFKNVLMPVGRMPVLGGDGGYFEPACFPPYWKRVGSFANVLTGTSSKPVLPAMFIAEGANGWSMVMGVDQMRPYADLAQSFVQERTDGMLFSVNFWSCGYARPNVRQTVGDICVMFSKCDRERMLKRVPDWYRALGQHVPIDRPSWIKGTVLYSMDPRGTLEGEYGEWGGFGPSRSFLPVISALGANTIWLRPVEDWKPYMPRDYYKLRADVGSEEDAKSFISDAHEMGLRVWRDAVMHGGHRDFPRAKEHPEWLAWKEDGSTMERFGYDYFYPTWVDYFANVIRDQTRKYQLDGWRLDIPGGSKTPNWNPDIPYPRASYAKLQGGISQQKAIRAAMKSVNPDSADLAESNGSVFGNTADSIYDQPLCHSHLLSLRSGCVEEKIADLRRWLHEQQYAYVPDTVMMRYVESHDSLRADLLYGHDACDALVALTAFIKGYPLVFQEGEVGHFEAWRNIFAARRKFPELVWGSCDYLKVEAPAGVFPVFREKDGCASVVLINLQPERVVGTVNWGGRPFTCDLRPYGWEIVRVKGPKSVFLPEKPYVPTCKLAQKARKPMVCDLTGKPFEGSYEIVSNVTAAGVCWRVEGLDAEYIPKVQLVVPIRNAQRWFARSADGTSESPFVPYRPYLAKPCRNGAYHSLREGEVIWDSRYHPFGFTESEASVGAVADGKRLQTAGFRTGQTVRLYERIADDEGLWIGVFGESGFPLELEIRESAHEAANAVVDNRNSLFRAVVGGWRYDDGRLRVQFMRNGALVGAWRREGVAWRRIAGRGTLWSDLGKKGVQEVSQENECDAMMKFERTKLGDFSFVVTDGCLRHPRKGGRLRDPDIRYSTRYVFCHDGSFDLKVEVRSPKDLATEGLFEYRLDVADEEWVNGNIVSKFSGCGVESVRDEDGVVHYSWMSKKRGALPKGQSALNLRFVNLPHGVSVDKAISLSGQGWSCDGLPVSVPHTWNVPDATIKKVATYKRMLPDVGSGLRAFVRFEGVSTKASVRVNGAPVGCHEGSTTAFVVEITNSLQPTGNQLEVVVDNRVDLELAPFTGDFNVYGGIYRDVTLITCREPCVDPMREVLVRPDAKTGVVRVTVPMLGASERVFSYKIDSWQLWTPENPHLYPISVCAGNSHFVKNIGFRTVEFRTDGFYLNGSRRKLRGVCRHQDREGRGWALLPEDEAEDVFLMKEMGADACRVGHMPHSRRFMELCDKEGLLVWVETTAVKETSNTPRGRANYFRQTREIVEQYRNHPSVFCWSIFNEIRSEDCETLSSLREARRIFESCDPTRQVVAAGSRPVLKILNAIPTAFAFNCYPQWYDYPAEWYGSRENQTMKNCLDVFLASTGRESVGVSEYGGGGSFGQHANPVARPDDVGGRFHPIEYQMRLHHDDYAVLSSDRRVWGTFVWNMFEFGSAGRREGARVGINDKGLVSYDRKRKKDAFFFYQANWRPDVPVLRICGKELMRTAVGVVDVVVLSNRGKVSLSLNGESLSSQTPDSVKTAIFKEVSLQSGENRIVATAGDQVDSWRVIFDSATSPTSDGREDSASVAPNTDELHY